MQILEKRDQAREIAKVFVDKSVEHKSQLSNSESEEIKQGLHLQISSLLDSWYRQVEHNQKTASVTYYTEKEGKPYLLHKFLDRELNENDPGWNFRANMSMRDVEQTSDLNINKIYHYNKGDK